MRVTLGWNLAPPRSSLWSVACLLSCLAVAVLGAPAGGGTLRAGASSSAVSPCGERSAPGSYRHVVWILLENEGYSVVGSPAAPYLDSLASSCALATNDHAVGHPSLPNYIALTSGSTQGISDDGEPAEHPLAGASLFGQLRGNWRALEESMTTDCDPVTSGSYAARHNPAVYYRSLGSACRRDDVPLTEPLQLSAAFTFITPNICDDMHSCAVSIGDAWLSRIVAEITSSTEYRAGSLVLFITFDENDNDATNRIPLYVVAPSVRRGARIATAFTHYSLLRTTEQLLGLPALGAAKTASSMLRPFNL